MLVFYFLYSLLLTWCQWCVCSSLSVSYASGTFSCHWNGSNTETFCWVFPNVWEIPRGGFAIFTRGQSVSIFITAQNIQHDTMSFGKLSHLKRMSDAYWHGMGPFFSPAQRTQGLEQDLAHNRHFLGVSVGMDGLRPFVNWPLPLLGSFLFIPSHALRLSPLELLVYTKYVMPTPPCLFS